MHYTVANFAVHNIAEPNWEVTLILGAVVGVLVIPIWQLIVYPARRLRPHSLNGRWYEYHLTFVSGRVALRFGIVCIKPGIRSRYIVTAEYSDGPPQGDGQLPTPKLWYRGRVLPSEADQVVILLKGLSHPETAVFRLLDRIPSNDNVVPGIWMAYDHDLAPAAGVAILSRSSLPPEQAMRMLQSWLIQEKGAMHLRKTPTVQRKDPNTR
jgi:hypothetical protein